MTARDALRTLNGRLRDRRPEGFGPIVGPKADNVCWTRGPLDYAVGCTDPIGEDEPDRMVVPAAFGLIECTLIGSIVAMGVLVVWMIGG